MAHSQRLAEQVKTLAAQVQGLKATIARARSNSKAPLNGTPPVSERGELLDLPFDGDLQSLADGLGSLSLGTDGQGRYFGGSAGSEVRPCLYILTLFALIPALVL